MDRERDKVKLLERRDLMNFARIRNAHPSEDQMVGDLLVRTFTETYAKKLPAALTTPEREHELRNVVSRRSNGVVRVIELGFQIIGTYALIHPGNALDESWTPNTCTMRCVAVDPRFHSLRLSESLIVDAIGMARTWSASHICLHVQMGAHGVGNLYKKFGFMRDQMGDKICMGNFIEGYLLPLQGHGHGYDNKQSC